MCRVVILDVHLSKLISSNNKFISIMDYASVNFQRKNLIIIYKLIVNFMIIYELIICRIFFEG